MKSTNDFVSEARRDTREFDRALKKLHDALSDAFTEGANVIKALRAMDDTNKARTEYLKVVSKIADLRVHIGDIRRYMVD